MFNIKNHLHRSNLRFQHSKNDDGKIEEKTENDFPFTINQKLNHYALNAQVIDLSFPWLSLHFHPVNLIHVLIYVYSLLVH